MIKEGRLEYVPCGNNFMVWGREYTVLDKNEKHVLALDSSVETEMRFRERGTSNEHNLNDFQGSSVHQYLAETYLAGLTSNGAELDRDILIMETDLKCTLGQHEYGAAKEYAGLLTLEQYGQYHDIIPKVERAYWLATPFRSARYAHAAVACSAWYVTLDGDYDIRYCGSRCGVRPLLTLSRDLQVYVEFYEDEREWDRVKMLDYVRKINQVNDEDFAVLAKRDFEVRKCLFELQRMLEADEKIREEGLETVESLRADNRRLRRERDTAISNLRYYGSSCAGCKWAKMLDGVARVAKCTHEKGCDAGHDYYELRVKEEYKDD